MADVFARPDRLLQPWNATRCTCQHSSTHLLTPTSTPLRPPRSVQDKAYEMLHNAVQWRTAQGVDEWRATPCDPLMLSELRRMIPTNPCFAYSKEDGIPIMVQRVGQGDAKIATKYPPDKHVRACVVSRSLHHHSPPGQCTRPCVHVVDEAAPVERRWHAACRADDIPWSQRIVTVFLSVHPTHSQYSRAAPFGCVPPIGS
jgi:hypothetical protein